MFFFNILYLNDNKYQTNVTIRYEGYKGKLLFNMKAFVSFVTYHKSMFLMPTIFLKYNIDGVRVPQFQLA